MRRSIALLIMTFHASYQSRAQPLADAPLCTTFYPTQFIAEFIADGTVPVTCPLPADADPIFWQPTRAEIARYQRASLIVINGAGFEKWIETAALPDSRIVDTARPFRAAWVNFETATHGHGGKGAHTHEGVDGHTWMDPQNARAQAEAIKSALAKRWPQHASHYEARFRQLAAEFDKLDERFKALTPVLEKARLFASHPAYNYIAKRYGWKIENVTLDPAADFTDVEIAIVSAALGKSSTGEGRRIMLWEESPKPQAAQQLVEQFEFTNVVFAPCEMLDPADQKAGETYLTLMHANLDRLSAACR